MLIPPVVAATGGLWLGVGAAVASARRVQLLLHAARTTRSASRAARASSALVVYVFMAMTLAILAARLREARLLANRRARNASLLGGLAVEMIRQSKLEPPLRSALHDLVEALELRGAHLEVTNALGERVEVDSGEVVEARALVPRDVVARRRSCCASGAGSRSCPSRPAMPTYGYLSVDPGPGPRARGRRLPAARQLRRHHRARRGALGHRGAGSPPALARGVRPPAPGAPALGLARSAHAADRDPHDRRGAAGRRRRPRTSATRCSRTSSTRPAG